MLSYKNIEKYKSFLIETNKKNIATQLGIATNFIKFLNGREITPDLMMKFCDTATKKSVVKYFLYSNNIEIETTKEEKDYTQSDNKSVEDFLKHKEFSGCQSSTIKGYKTKLEKYFREYNKLTEANAKEYLKKESITVKESWLNLFNQFAKYHKIEFKLYINKKELSNAKAELIKVKVLSKEEVRKLLKFIDKLNEAITEDYLLKTILILYLYTGCRLSELQRAKFADLNLDTKELQVIGKGNKRRTVYLTTSPQLLLFIRSHYKKYSSYLKKRDLPLICNQNFQHVSTSYIQQKVKEAFQELGFDNEKSTHSLRHTFGTILCNNNVPLKNIQKTLGHKNQETTLIYADISEQTKKAVRNKFKI